MSKIVCKNLKFLKNKHKRSFQEKGYMLKYSTVSSFGRKESAGGILPLRAEEVYMHEKLVIVSRKEIYGEEDFKRGMVCAGMPVLFICDVGADFICGAVNYFCHPSGIFRHSVLILSMSTPTMTESSVSRESRRSARERDLEEFRWKMSLHWHRRGTGVYASMRMIILLPVRI